MLFRSVTGASVTLTGTLPQINAYLAAGKLKMFAAADTTLSVSIGSAGLTVTRAPVSVKVIDTSEAKRDAALNLPDTVVVRNGALVFADTPFGIGNATRQLGGNYSLIAKAGLVASLFLTGTHDVPLFAASFAVEPIVLASLLLIY